MRAPLVRRSAFPANRAQQQREAGLPAEDIGTTILEAQFPPATDPLKLAVQIAWGGTYAHPELWSWTDVTADVQAAEKVVISIGKKDENSTPPPATCQFTLDNRSGRYSQGGQSVNWPNVKRGVPIRVVMVYRGNLILKFQGYAVGFSPDWDVTGKWAAVKVVAAGTKQRLQQQKAPIQSVLTRSVPALPNLVAHWPCEDGVLATQLASTTPNVAPITPVGASNFASYGGFVATTTAPTFASDNWLLNFPSYVDTTAGQIRFLLNTPSSGFPDQTRILTLYCAGSISRIELRYAGTQTNGQQRLLAYKASDGSVAYDTGTIGLNMATIGPAVVSVQWSSGGTFTYSVGNQLHGLGVNIGTAPGFSVGTVGFGVFNPDSGMQGASAGQVWLQATSDNLSDMMFAISGYNGEYLDDRMRRLCAEQGESLLVSGISYTRMGSQVPDTLLNLLQACVDVDTGGMLVDGASTGLFAGMRSLRVNQLVTAMTLDASQGHVEFPVLPVDDDQVTVNSFVATKIGGSSSTVTNTTGALGTQQIGTYEGSASYNCSLDGQQLTDLAAWAVHMGSMPFQGMTYRWPQVSIAIHHHPELLLSWLTTTAFSRIEIANLNVPRTQVNNARLQFQLEGYTETVDQFTWRVDMNLARMDLWKLGQITTGPAPSGEPYPMRLETPGTVVASVQDSQTFYTLDTAGIVWTNDPNDFPMRIEIDGNQYQALSIGGFTPGATQQVIIDPTFHDTSTIRVGGVMTVGLPTFLEIGRQ